MFINGILRTKFNALNINLSLCTVCLKSEKGKVLAFCCDTIQKKKIMHKLYKS